MIRNISKQLRQRIASTQQKTSKNGIRRFSEEAEKPKAASSTGEYPNLAPEDVPEPPGVFATVGAMGAGAAGAIFVAGLGVVAVFKMAFYVAGGTGRSIHVVGSSTESASTSSSIDGRTSTSAVVDANSANSNKAGPSSPKETTVWDIFSRSERRQ